MLGPHPAGSFPRHTQSSSLYPVQRVSFTYCSRWFFIRALLSENKTRGLGSGPVFVLLACCSLLNTRAHTTSISRWSPAGGLRGSIDLYVGGVTNAYVDTHKIRHWIRYRHGTYRFPKRSSSARQAIRGRRARHYILHAVIQLPLLLLLLLYSSKV